MQLDLFLKTEREEDQEKQSSDGHQIWGEISRVDLGRGYEQRAKLYAPLV